MKEIKKSTKTGFTGLLALIVIGCYINSVEDTPHTWHKTICIYACESKLVG